MRIIGMDIHRVAAEALALLDGKFEKLGRIPMLRERLEEFARTQLTLDNHVIVEATGNAAAVVEVLAPHVDRVVIANPKQVRRSHMPRSRPMRLMLRCWPSFMHRASCRKSGFPTQQHSPSGDR